MSGHPKRIFGIDLGTTYSSIACVDEYGKTVVIPNSESQRLTPSVVFFNGNNIIVGDIAKENSKLYPNDVVSFVKRSMGEPNFIFEHNAVRYRAEEISSFIIRKIVQDAEHYLGLSGTENLVITCPAYFGINEREATKRAGEIAGFDVRQIINEPTAAAIAYGSIETDEERVILVYDLGGGTFDITMIDIKPDESIEVICTGGDHNLGGKDFDDRVIAYLVEEFQNQTGIREDILADADTCQDLQLSAEKAKKNLTQLESTKVLITHGGERIKLQFERKVFERLTQDLLERTIALTHDMLEEAVKKGYKHFDEIILVGGSTRMPMVVQRIKKEFGIEPKLFDPDEAVAKGAAIYGWKLFLQDEVREHISQKTGKKIHELEDFSALDLDDIIEEVEQLVANDTGYSIEDIQNAKLKIKNVTSKSFGVVAHDQNGNEIVYNLILKNNDVPVNTKKTFGTAVDNQEIASIQIMENEENDVVATLENSILIGTAVLNLPPDIAANTPIEIIFKLNREGRMEITAEEMSDAHRSVSVTIETRSVIRGKEFEEAKARAKHIVVI
ncbi:Hsp70 family protein [Desulfococcus multivorans]|uniref:Heat shock protein 70 n=2 Tax=Desulfococcus TaxID=896 RepID=S7TKZ6_DESML|nr:Hsp70 family protein [Desulfococcus multivorans]AQV00360.1 molecular chaperone DnaK [Desulfococcus multivorans]EPR37300.1 Heat shock protein 70 [Desulfococcus multivorans DSM 2059]SJZ69885.1 Molecular chaperone DnaK (HSP70) [Desulfococcus multivorans DSM 2059]